MPQHADHTNRQENKAASQPAPLKESAEVVLQPFEDQRSISAQHSSLLSLINRSAQVSQLQTYQRLIDGSAQVQHMAQLQLQANVRAERTRPTQLKEGSDEAERPPVMQRQGDGPANGGKYIAESNPQQGQLTKTGFLEKLQNEVFLAADSMLAEIDQSAAQCPYLIKWFGYYADKDAAHIEQAISRFAPGTATADNLDAYINAIVARVKTGLRNHIDTGTVDDVPAEILDDKPLPGDFLHIMERNQSVAQLSCLWTSSSSQGGSGGRGNPKYDRLERIPMTQKPVSKPKVKRHFIGQGLTAFGKPGDEVQNMGTTSCGLVIAFGSDQIGMYHWPFMTNSSEYRGAFAEVVNQVGQLNRIEIITNDYHERSREDYFNTVRWIRGNFGVTTVYYVHPNEFRGIDPHGHLEDNHFNSMNAVEERQVD